MKGWIFVRGERVLDVAAGNGNATLAAARRFASVTSTDYVPALLERGRRRADAEGLDVTFEVADAEALPYPDASFDVVLSTFGVMFAPDHEQAAGELMRVCRPGGRIGLASWTPHRLPRTAPSGDRPLRAAGPGFARRFCGGPRRTSRSCSLARRRLRIRLDTSRSDIGRRSTGLTCSGLTTDRSTKPFAALDADGQAALEADLIALLRTATVGGPDGLVVPGEYLETVITNSSSRRADTWHDESHATPRLMAVLAHPDDESLGVGGTLAKYASEGVDVFLLTATRGDSGRYRGYRPDDPRHPGPVALATIREAELRAAASVLGVREVSLLDYRDQHLDRCEPTRRRREHRRGT